MITRSDCIFESWVLRQLTAWHLNSNGMKNRYKVILLTLITLVCYHLTSEKKWRHSMQKDSACNSPFVCWGIASSPWWTSPQLIFVFVDFLNFSQVSWKWWIKRNDRNRIDQWQDVYNDDTVRRGERRNNDQRIAKYTQKKSTNGPRMPNCSDRNKTIESFQRER